MELKPCPFCGGRVYVSYWSKTQNFYIYHYKKKKCPVLEVELDATEMQSLDDDIVAWNRRYDPQVDERTRKYWENTQDATSYYTKGG